jgi:hypothetical protein
MKISDGDRGLVASASQSGVKFIAATPDLWDWVSKE